MHGDLIKERDFITAVLQACGALVVVFDAAGRIVLCNRAFEQVTGYSSAELKGKIFFDVLVSPRGPGAEPETFGVRHLGPGGQLIRYGLSHSGS